MKIPAVALAAAFGGGKVLGLQPQIGSHINSRLFLIPALLGVAAVKPPRQEVSAEPHTQPRRMRHPFLSTKTVSMRHMITQRRLGGVDAPDYYQYEQEDKEA